MPEYLDSNWWEWLKSCWAENKEVSARLGENQDGNCILIGKDRVMKKKSLSKKLFLATISLIICMFICSSTTFANEVVSVSEEIPVYGSNREAFDSQYTPNIRSARLEPVFIRSGDTTKVEVYVQYTGDDPANAVKITNFEIWNTNLLNRKQLVPTFSPGTRNFMAAKEAHVRLKEVKLATSVKAVRVDVGTYQAYIMGYGWISAGDPVGQKPIK